MLKQFVVATWNVLTFLAHGSQIALSSDEVQLQIQRDLPLHQPLWTPAMCSYAKLVVKHSLLAGYDSYHLIQMIFNCHVAAHWSCKTCWNALTCHCVWHKALSLEFVTIQIWYQESFFIFFQEADEPGHQSCLGTSMACCIDHQHLLLSQRPVAQKISPS